MRISDWSSDVCSSDLYVQAVLQDVEGLAQTQDQAGVHDVLRGGAPMDVLCRVEPARSGDRLAQGGDQRRHRNAVARGAFGETGGVDPQAIGPPTGRAPWRERSVKFG